MLPYYSNSSKILLKHESSTDNDDSDHNERDPGREVIEKNIRNRLKRIADQTKEELNKVLKRVDNTLHHYEYSLQSSLIQHGMTTDDMTNVEHVADIKELEDLLNDSLAKQRYKQRLMIFIVGQTEQASEKVKLLQQIGQFFNEQKQNFSEKEFNIHDDINEVQDEIDTTLKSFDIKDCYIHVKELGTRLNELNEEIIQYLIQNAGTKQQTKGKKKLVQVTKETKDQLTNLQTKIEEVNAEMINKDNKIETLEKEIETIRNELKVNEKKLHDELKHYGLEIKTYKKQINELEHNITEYQNQIDDLTKTLSTTHQSIIQDATDTKKTNDGDNKSAVIIENLSDLKLLLNLTDEIDFNNITIENLPTAFSHLQKLAITRIRELLKELEIRELTNNETVQNLKQEFDEHKITCEKEQNTLIEKADTAYQLQIEAQKTAEEALNNLELFMAEQEKKLKSNLIHQETQTYQEDILHNITSSPETLNPIEEQSRNHSLSQSMIINEENQSTENLQQISSKDISLLDQLKQQADIVLSRSASIKERSVLQSFENSTDNESMNKQDQQQQTSRINSRHSSINKEKISTQIIAIDQFKLPFFHLYEIIYKFRYSIINLLEQNKFNSFADRLQMTKQLSSDDNHITNDFIENSECILKDIIKILQICMKTLSSTINEYQTKPKEPEPIIENSAIDNQQSSILQEKDLKIHDLTTKNEDLNNALNQMNKKYAEESNHHERLLLDQQKLIQTLQQELIRVQKRLSKIEDEGILEPSIMFTRLDVERNEQTLQQAVVKGKVPESTYTELNETMTDYVRLPSQQLSNLIKRYMQFRKAVEIENRIQNESLDDDTKNTLEKMESLYERRSDQLSKHMLNLRQQRENLAKTLTEKFDHLENESSIFLIRPIYSYQGRTAAQIYMKQEKRRREAFLKENIAKKKHHPSRLSYQAQTESNQQIPTTSSSISTPDDDERFFRIETSFGPPRSTLTEQQNDSTNNTADTKQVPIQLNEFTRLQELDFQRTLMPVSHTSTPLLSAFTNSGIDLCVPSLNLRSYVSLSRPGAGNVRIGKSNEVINPISRERISLGSAKSQVTNPRTPHNSSAGDLRRGSPHLPPIKKSLTLNVSPTVNEKQHSGIVPSVTTNETAVTN